MKRALASLALITLLFASSLPAAVPQEMSYQGVLTDGAGTAMPDGNYSMSFRIYDVASGGSALWTEAQSVAVSGGIFNATLGSVVPLTLAFDVPYYLGITVAAGPEMTPRRPLSASAYSLNSQAVSGSANVFKASGNVGIGTTTPSAPLEIKHDTNISSSPAIAIDNSAGSSPQDAIDFRFNGITEARIRKSGSGGDLFIGTLVPSTGLTMQTNNVNRLKITSGGNVGIGNVLPSEKLDITGGLKIGTTSNTNAGTLRWTGSDFEGYNGSAWKSLTGGAGGTLPSGTSGQMLRHDASSWVASGTIFDVGSKIGIGTQSPGSDLHIYQDANTVVGIKIENPNIGSNSMERVILADENGEMAGIIAYDNDNISYANRMRIFNNRPSGSLQFVANGQGMILDSAGKLGIGTTSPLDKLHVIGGASLGSASADGWLKLYRSGYTNPVIFASHNIYGGILSIRDESYNSAVELQADGSTGGGGVLMVKRDEAGNTGFEANGNFAGSNEPYVAVTGSARSAVMRMDASGDASVSLPVSAINSTEMFDEPGVASATNGASGVTMSPAVQTLLVRSINVPSAGYVLVIGTCQPWISHTNGTQSFGRFGVSDVVGVLPANQDVDLILPSSAPTGSYYFPATVQGIFEVTSAGSKFFYLLGQEVGGNIVSYDMQLSLVFVPTQYGTVTPTLASSENIPDDHAPVRSGLTAAEIAKERLESQAANQARIDRELAAMRAELDAVKEELARERQRQGN